MPRVVRASERRLAEAVASGTLAATLSASPRVYQVWAKRIGPELARLGVVGSLTELIGVLRKVEDGTWGGGERLLDMADALRGLLDRSVAWEGASEELPPAVVVAAQSCLSALQPSMIPSRILAPDSRTASPGPAGGVGAGPSDPSRGHTLEMVRLLEQLRKRTGAFAILILDRVGQLLATNTPDEALGNERASAVGSLAQLSPEMLSALPRVEWTHRFVLEEGREILLSSLAGNATLVVVGNRATFWAGFAETDTRSALESLLRRILEHIEGLETQRVLGFLPEDLEEPFR